MAERYLCEYDDGTTTVQFNMSPNNNRSGPGEIGTVSVGDSVYISGQVRNTGAKINSMEIKMVVGSATVSNTLTISNVARNTWRKFSASLKINDASGGRGAKVYLGFTVNGSSGQYSAYYYTYYSYYVEPKITSLILQRCDSSGKDDNEGNYVKCAELRIGIGGSASYTDITQMSISTSPSVFSTTYTDSALNSIVQRAVSSYYSDSSPTSKSALLGGKTFTTGVDYDVTITLTAGTETSTYKTSISRSFAKLHIAGNATGGVAIGMFSTSDDDGQPRFEVASSHETYFKGAVHFEQPVDFKSSVTGIQSQNDSYSSGEHATGKTWIDGKTVYRYVLTGSYQVTAEAEKITIYDGLPKMTNVISVTGSITTWDKGWIFGLTHVGKGGDAANATIRLERSGDTGSVVMVTGSDIKGVIDYVVIVEYTK